MQGSNRVVRWYPHHLDMCELNEFDRSNIGLFADYRGYLETYANAGLLWPCIGVHWPFLTTFQSKWTSKGFSLVYTHQMLLLVRGRNAVILSAKA